MHAHHLIIRPLISEKSMAHADKGQYHFAVALHTNKDAIKRAIEEQFKVHVVSVATTTLKGRTKRIGQRRMEVTIAPWKKAIIGVKTGEKIAIFDVAV